jgi:hypothetical protein
MSISNVNSATKVQGSKQVNNTRTESTKTADVSDVDKAKGSAATVSANTGRESAAALVNAGGLLGPDQAKLSGFAAVQAAITFDQPLKRSTQLLHAMGERSKLPETATA